MACVSKFYQHQVYFHLSDQPTHFLPGDWEGG